MKRLLTAAIALTLVGGSAASAQPYGHDRQDSRYDQRDHRADRHDNRDNHAGRHDNGRHRGHKKWVRGQHLPHEYRGRGYYVDYRAHHLRQPPRGYQWVRVNDDYMMVALATGLIASIIANN